MGFIFALPGSFDACKAVLGDFFTVLDSTRDNVVIRLVEVSGRSLRQAFAASDLGFTIHRFITPEVFHFDGRRHQAILFRRCLNPQISDQYDSGSPFVVREIGCKTLAGADPAL